MLSPLVEELRGRQGHHNLVLKVGQQIFRYFVVLESWDILGCLQESSEILWLILLLFFQRLSENRHSLESEKLVLELFLSQELGRRDSLSLKLFVCDLVLNLLGDI